MTDGAGTAMGVLFDLDGTLVDSEPTHHRALLDVLAAEGVTPPDGFERATTGLTMRAAYDLLRSTTGLALGYDALVTAKYAAYLRRRSELALRPGAEAALATVRDRGVPFAIVSNSDRILVGANLDAVGLALPDLVSVSRNDVRRGKPDPEPYLRAAWLLGVDPARCVVVEDSAVGAAAGLAAGAAVIGWPEPHRAADLRFPAGALVADPADLAGPLEDLLRRSAFA